MSATRQCCTLFISSALLLTSTACEKSALTPETDPLARAESEGLTAVRASFSPPGAVPERLRAVSIAEMEAGQAQFVEFLRWPAEDVQTSPNGGEYLAPVPMADGNTAYNRDLFIGGMTSLTATHDGETLDARAISPAGQVLDWPAVTYYKEYNGQKDCFVSSAWIQCGSPGVWITWYTKGQCQTTGTWTMKFYHDGSEFHEGQFKLLPRIPPGKVPLKNQLAYPNAPYARWCKGPGGPHKCDGRAGEEPYTIAQRGCALVSGAMVLAYHGVDVDPVTLNRWMNENNGFSGGSAVDFSAIARYGQVVGGKRISYMGRTNIVGDPGLPRLECEFGPQVLSVYGSSRRQFFGGHFVAATGQNEAKTTHVINDPAGGLATSLLAVARYRNAYGGTRRFRGPLRQWSDNHGAIIGFLHSPAELLITDGAGRRTGFDPNSGQVFNEIPGATYDSVGIVDP